MRIRHHMSDGSARVFNLAEDTNFDDYMEDIVDCSKNGNWTLVEMDEETVCLNPAHIISVTMMKGAEK